MAIPSRIMTEPTIKQLADANLANIDAMPKILHIAEHLEPSDREKLYEAVTDVLKNSGVIAKALLSAPSARN
jgi:hypothetical protein